MYWRFLYFALVIALGVLESALVLASGDFRKLYLFAGSLLSEEKY